MPDDLHSLSDLVADAFDLADIEVNELLQDAPLAAALPMVPSSNGTVHKWARQVGAPPVGFRSVNAGRATGHSTDEVVSADLEILDWTVKCDAALADAWRKGREDYLLREALRSFVAAMFTYGTQLVNGQLGAAATGFAGFRDATTIDALADEMVVNAGGSGSTLSSVYGVRLGTDGIAGVYKGEGSPIEIGMSRSELLTDGSGDEFNGYVTPGHAWLGLQVASKWSIGRLANCTATNVTDDALYELDSLFPTGRKPTHYVMSRRSLESLRKSRTTYHPQGAPAPRPDSVAGKPIIVTDEVSNAEAAIA